MEDTDGYDRANRVTAATFRQGTTVLASLGFGRDPEGMVTSTTGSGIAGAADAFTYGPFDQLATNSAGTFTYDAADNLTGFPDGRKQRFNAANELCYAATTNTAACGSAPAGAIRYEYDGRGNRTAQRPTGAVPTTMTYDQADRMTSARVPSQPDGSGQYHDMTGATVWYSAGESLVANQVKTYQITGANGIPATGVESVVLRLHVAGPANYGYLSAFPTGGSANGTVAMYLNPDETATNLAVSKLNGSGQVSVQTTVGTLISVELVGWYGNTSATGGFSFEPVTPARALQAAVVAGSTTSVPVTGAYSVPSTGVSAVAVVAHSLATAPSGYLTVYSGPTQPGSVTLLYDSGYGSALTIVPVGPDGVIKLYTTAATTAVLDIVGYYRSIESGDGNIAHTLTPSFIADTANHTGTCNGGTCNRLVANTPTTIDVTGVGGIPASGVASVAVVLQTYVPDAPGYVTTHATGTAQPYAAAMVFDDAFTSTTAIVPVGTDGTITVFSSTGVDLIVQTIGYFDAASKTYTYAYSGDGLRRSKTAPEGTVTKFIWDRSGALPLLLAEAIDEPGTTNDRTVRYLYGPGGTVTSDITTMTTSGTEALRWYHQDQLGSTRALTSSSGAVLSTFSYSPFGAPGAVVGSATTPIGWAGEYRDPETGYVYLRARYYDPATAQFLTRDPLEAITRSAYGYAGNNPLNVTDPTGMCPWCIAIVVGAVIGGGIDLGFQMLDNAIAGCGLLDDINWTSVAFWSFVGGATAGGSQWLRAGRGGRLALRGDIALSGGRSGGRVKSLTGPVNSILRGQGGRVYVTDSQGRVIWDITRTRVKPVIPGRGFGPKRAPTAEELKWIDDIFGSGP